MGGEFKEVQVVEMETWVDDDKCTFCVDRETHPDVALIHLDVRKWSHTLFKNYYLPAWHEILERLKEEGAHSVCAIIPANDKKVSKFHAMLGMYEAYNDGTHRINRRWL